MLCATRWPNATQVALLLLRSVTAVNGKRGAVVSSAFLIGLSLPLARSRSARNRYEKCRRVVYSIARCCN
jgi:hypothetical protein